MFKKILVPVDGSDVSKHAAQAAAELARLSGARLVALYVAPAYKPNVHEESTSLGFVSPDEYAKRARLEAAPHLASVAEAAKSVGAASEAQFAMSDSIADAIVDTATQHGCDTIVMGSHGHTGIRKMLLGSVAQQVLGAATIPVVVTR